MSGLPSSSLPPPGQPLLSLSKVEVVYPNGTRALHPSSLAVARGSFVVLLGASGAGKSTLLRCINGLVMPTAGQIQVADLGDALRDRGVLREHRRRTGMIFQHHHLIGRQTVLGNVLMGRLARHGRWASLLPASRDDQLQALAAIERVGLLEKALARADALSGGQQQRVGIARALVQQPRLMLADEPVASLDPATSERVLALLRRICKDDGLTAVLSLHQVSLALAFADRIVGLRAGHIVFDGSPSEWSNAAETEIYGATSSSSAAEEEPDSEFPYSFITQPSPLEATLP